MNSCQLSSLLAFVFLLAPQLSLQQEATLTIEPMPAITGDTVTFTCLTVKDGYGLVTYELIRDGNVAVKVNVRCPKDATVKADEIKGTLDANCDRLIVKDVKAVRGPLTGKYQCKTSNVGKDFTRNDFNSKTIDFDVGDKTPPITKFEAKVAKTNAVVKPDGALEAGTNITVTCEAANAVPRPKYEVTITDKETRYNRTDANKVYFMEVVPRLPEVAFKCSVFNGFGERQEKSFSMKVNYGPLKEELTIPTELQVPTEEEVAVCSVPNNPPKIMEVTGIDADLLEAGYPRNVPSGGKSIVVIRLTAAAQELQEIEIQCKHPDLVAVSATIRLTAPRSAMMMVGIVVAVLVVFLVIVAALAYLCKKRDAAAKSSSAAGGYQQANQNDNDGRKAPKKLDDMPSTDV